MKQTAKTTKKLIRKNKSKNNLNKILFFALSVLAIALFASIILYISLKGLDKKANNSVGNPLASYPIGTVDPSIKFRFALGSSDLRQNQENHIKVYVESGQKLADGIQLALNYDKNKVEIGRVENLFLNIYAYQKIDNDGKLTIFYYPPDKTGVYSGDKEILRIYFKPKNQDNSDISIECNSLLKSKITHTGSELINCGAANKIELRNIAAESGTGGGGSNQGSTSNRPNCDVPYPQIPTNLRATSGPGVGEIHLTWNKVTDNTHHYTVTFGERWLDFDYGSPDIGNTDQFLIRFLKPGVLYYVVVTAVNECGGSSGYSDGASALSGIYSANYYADKGGYASQNTPQNTPKPEEVITDEQWEDLEASEAADTEDSFDDDWYTEATPEPSLEPVLEEDTEKAKFNLSKALSFIGLGVLVILGILLFKFAKGSGDDELPPIPEIGKDDNEPSSWQNKDEINQQGKEVPPPFN